MKAHIIGGGLIGTSMGLALKSLGWSVSVSDSDLHNADLAKDLLIADPLDPHSELVVVATPPEVVFQEITKAADQFSQATIIDISGLKSDLLLEVEKFPDLSSRFIGTHPMAGRESSGPQNARGDLFEGRAWILTPSTKVSSERIELVNKLVTELGATPYFMSAEKHDQAISLISHLPQMVSSLLGSLLVNSDEESLQLAGQGLRDVSRLGGSDPELWSELLVLNASENATHLRALISRSQALLTALENSDRVATSKILSAGNIGREKIPGKHGAKNRDYTFLPIVIDDRPGQLAKIFIECDSIGVNVEDLSIEHTPGQETGLITLSLSESDASKLQQHLVNKGWLAHAPRK